MEKFCCNLEGQSYVKTCNHLLQILDNHPVWCAGNIPFNPGQKLAFVRYQSGLHVVVVPSIEDAQGMLAEMDIENIREEEDEER